MARSSTGTAVAALTAAAIAAVGFLAYQANATAPDHPTQTRSDSRSSGPKEGGKEKEGRDPKKVPADSGTGRRVVYALEAKRVWLVGADERPLRSFKVAPSSVDPEPGAYGVTSRSAGLVGSDGVQVEHVVIFHQASGIVFGFSSALDGSTPNPNARKRTGGIRQSREDGSAMWDFATNETKVVVVP
ncbi:hypothetical protein [Streptomyces sp. XD-27]|uniref:hypothetical protein n=1 Tax=Streptomyces sp. XD-27 TaxID=3062779 RepID=UPI0026F45227|nr:hypothetical protein [Streptomyces sp. XD-27]WKX72048.1 hypothetical protein Q3Y56_20990 [Streptomyces sp. XD-27]